MSLSIILNNETSPINPLNKSKIELTENQSFLETFSVIHGCEKSFHKLSEDESVYLQKLSDFLFSKWKTIPLHTELFHITRFISYELYGGNFSLKNIPEEEQDAIKTLALFLQNKI